MSALFNTILFLTLQATIVLSALPQVDKCSLSDAGCLKTSAQKIVTAFTAGIPEVGSETLEPIHVKTIKIDLSGLKLTVKDAVITGLGTSKIENLVFDTDKKIVKLTFVSTPIELKGQYKAAGRLLILPISGDGDVTIFIDKLVLHMDMPYEITKNENGKDAIELKSYKYTYENTVRTHFTLTNLFNGNKELSDTMHTFMNENWQAISQEFGNPMLEKPMQKIFTAIRKFLLAQALEDIAVV
ncbi:circadian clock-controlled protein daywake-like [Anticarsia gemmatalis]|uniref:circadian clock-controlled protein daywake-like n=1 Tax=Anticarsia gemmatalis TaxID=129554 RepID=UPI003F76B9AC